MKKVLYSLVFLALALACDRDQSELRFQKQLALAELLMEDNPDSSYQILQEVARQVGMQQKSLQMEYRLLLANAQNRSDRAMTMPDKLQPVVEYYETQGNGHRQMLAYYLMGRSFLDNREFPLAAECFQRVFMVADSLGRGADYHTLFRTHSQLAYVYQEQRLFDKARQEDSIAAQITLEHGDTAMYFRFQEMLLGDLNLFGDIDKILSKSEELRQQHLQSGRVREAAMAHVYAIGPLVQKGRLTEAREAISDFEANSGLFDEVGNMQDGNRFYYYKKGCYYLACKDWGKAEECFRRLTGTGMDDNCHEAGYKGLLDLYRHQGIADSVGKYADMYCTLHDSTAQAIAAAEVGTIESLYDYNRNKLLAERKTRENGRLRIAIGITVVLAMLCIFLSVLILRNTKRAKSAEIRRMKQSLVNKREEYELLMSDKDRLAKRYEADLQELERLLSADRVVKEKRQNLRTEVENNLLQRMKVMGSNYGKPDAKKEKVQLPTKREWRMLDAYMEDLFPELHERVVEQRLSEMDSHIVYFIRLGFDDDAIREILNVHGNSFTNRKMRISEKLFGKKTALKLRQMVMERN